MSNRRELFLMVQESIAEPNIPIFTSFVVWATDGEERIVYASPQFFTHADAKQDAEEWRRVNGG